jgi:hypothetical protein
MNDLDPATGCMVGLLAGALILGLLGLLVLVWVL